MHTHDSDIRIYPQYPRVGVGIVIFKDKSVLLIKRGKEPNKGIWTLPGGLILTGESVEQATHREVYEECNIRIRLLNFVDFFEFIELDSDQRIKYHYIVIDLAAEYVSGKLQALSDAQDAKWISVNHLFPHDLTDNTLEIINRAQMARMN